MIDPDISSLWTPTGLLLGFQVTLFKWRLEREVQLGDQDNITWLVPSDYVSILGMLCFVIGVVLLPASGLIPVSAASAAFGLGAIFFVGQALGLAGHYELYNRQKRKFFWFPTQEKIVLGLTAFVALLYIIVILWKT